MGEAPAPELEPEDDELEGPLEEDEEDEPPVDEPVEDATLWGVSVETSWEVLECRTYRRRGGAAKAVGSGDNISCSSSFGAVCA